MSVNNLQRGQGVSIGLKRLVVGLKWDPNQSDNGQRFDLDASAFLLNDKQKLPEGTFFVFYNNTISPDGAVETSGDDSSGGNSDGDDETLKVDLEQLDSRVQEIVIAVTIHDADAKRQTFGQVRKSFIRIYDADNESNVLCMYELDEDFSVETALEFGRLYKRDGAWKFEAVGAGFRGGLQALLDKYL
jgi:tellurium resistance protein TerD